VAEPGQNPPEDEDDPEGLNPREILFVDALAIGTPPREAAMQTGISERTGRRWRQKPSIIAALRSRLNDAIAVGKSILAAGMAKAATGLVSMASGDTPAESARVAACRAVTEGAVKLCELADLQAQLAEIQQQLGALPGNHKQRM
jgi:hypothetical protein